MCVKLCAVDWSVVRVGGAADGRSSARPYKVISNAKCRVNTYKSEAHYGLGFHSTDHFRCVATSMHLSRTSPKLEPIARFIDVDYNCTSS